MFQPHSGELARLPFRENAQNSGQRLLIRTRPLDLLSSYSGVQYSHPWGRTDGLMVHRSDPCHYLAPLLASWYPLGHMHQYRTGEVGEGHLQEVHASHVDGSMQNH